MKTAYICDAIRTPFGRLGGTLAPVRTDDLAAIPIKSLMQRNTGVDWEQLDDVIYGDANQAGEDNRNVARMALLLAGLPYSVPGVTVNRLCGSGMQAVANAMQAIAANEASLIIAGGVESMSRSPYVISKSSSAYGRDAQMHDSTLGWRFVNPLMKARYGVDPLAETAENLVREHNISREDQDRFAMRSQEKAGKAQASGLLDEEITPVEIPQRKGAPIIMSKDEHPRSTSMEALAKLSSVTGKEGHVTAGNASGMNDGAAALLVADEATARRFSLTPKARIVGTAVAGVPPRIMGIGPVPAVQKLLPRLGLTLDQMDILEFNEAFSAQALAVARSLGLADDDERINPLGGAIALGHPLGASGARLVTTAMRQLQRTQKRYALCAMCIGVGQGIAMVLERT